jgi:hypothetical protein
VRRTQRVGPRSLLLALLIALAGSAGAQFASTPFFDHAELLGETFGYELATVRLNGLASVLAAGEEAEADDLGEEIEALLEADLPRFLGTLVARDPGLADEVEERFEALESALTADDEDALEAAVEGAQRALDLVGEALDGRQMLGEDAGFSAAVMTLLLLSSQGIGERYEEVVEGELALYPGGWHALARVEELWSGLEPLANDVQRFEVEDMLDQLEMLFPGPVLDDDAVLIDAEAAEDPAQRMVGFLEEVADAALYPDRNLGDVIVMTRDLVAAACESLEAEDDASGAQTLAIAGFYYAQYVEGTVGLLAPEANESLEPLWSRFAEEEGEDDEGDEAEQTDEDDEGADEVDCPALLDGLREAGALFGV